jgi:hypothetical protein
MKLVEHNSALSKALCRPLDVSRTHVHGNGFDLKGSPPCSRRALTKVPRASALRPSTVNNKREFSASRTVVT